MAYFSNGSEGAKLDEQCGHCKFGKGPCPIYRVQSNFNYDQFTDGKPNLIFPVLEMLINADGICELFKNFLGEIGDEFAKKTFPGEMLNGK